MNNKKISHLLTHKAYRGVIILDNEISISRFNYLICIGYGTMQTSYQYPFLLENPPGRFVIECNRCHLQCIEPQVSAKVKVMNC